MKDEETFLARWSRRKRESAAPAPKAEPPAPAAAESLPPATPAVDPATLPSIDLIEAGTDIKAFLAQGVPAHLTRAALRRAWSADPSIRDFVGLSENSWDFNAVGGVPGFGTIAPEEVQRILAQALGSEEKPEPKAESEPISAETPVSRTASAPAPPAEIEAAPAATNASAEPEEPVQPQPAAPRRHGSALPT